MCDSLMSKSKKSIKSYSINGQTRSEEILNAVSHGLGIGLSIAALVILEVLASRTGDPWKIVSFSIYGVSLIILYSVSTIYHTINEVKIKRILQILDHSSIFILIAGSYTPFVLVNMRGPWGWSIFGLIWAIAIFGIILKLTNENMSEKATVLIYLCMGWLIIIPFQKLIETLSIRGIIWLFTGGVLYSLGVVFFFLDRRVKYAHFIFHLFILGGSIAQFFAILFHVLTK